uniref:Uncharacterized protein n=1 Tax=Parascaris univalens TaxID=6257 RepID=A0A915AS22_PARUN
MSTAKGLEEMRADLMVAEEQLRAKCALLEEAMSVIANIPPHPANNDFIPNVLGVRVKCAKDIHTNVSCRFDSANLFDDWICVAISVHNESSLRCVVNCTFVCESQYTPMVESSTAIFDSLMVTDSVPGKSVRRVVSAFPSGVSIEGRVQLMIECKEVQDTDHCNLHPCLLTALPSDCKLEVSLFSFFVPEDIRATNVGNILNFSIDEAEWLYQCLYVTHFSRHVDLMPSQALAALRRLGTFIDVDFGDWQLSVGEVGTRWQGISFYCSLSHLASLPSGCRIFTRREEDLMRLVRKLCAENDQS